MSAGTLVLNYNAANDERSTPPHIEEETPISRHTNNLGTSREFAMNSDGARNQKYLC
jgi:hypothetical protein